MIQSAKRNVRALVFLAKAKGIKHVVFSPGSRNAPLVIGFTNDDFFNCMVVHDERSAAFVALGIAQATGVPVMMCCTSGSAAANYYPAITEAFYQQIPIIAVTADRPSEWIDQADGQTIRQENLFANHINYSCNLYKDVADRELQIYNERVLNEALNTAHLTSGPVHINMPFQEPLYDSVEDANDQFKLIEQVHIKPELQASWAKFGAAWQNAKTKIVLFGQHPERAHLGPLLAKLNEDPAVLIFTESTSNVNIPNSIQGIDKLINTIEENEKKAFAVDVLLTVDGAVISKKVKALFREHQPKQHWHISPKIPNPDTYQSLTHSVVAEPKDFFSFLGGLKINEKSAFKTDWLAQYKIREQRHLEFVEKVPFGDFKAFYHILKNVPETAALQIGNSSVIRYVQLFNEGRNVPHFSNRGAAGIDGSSSTAVGFCIGSGKQTILLSGDVSFLYDSNAFFHNHVPKIFKAIVINNGGGNIFRIIPGPATTNKLDNFFEAQHSAKISGIAQAFNLKHAEVFTEEELTEILPEFLSPKSGIQILEIHTDKVASPQQLKNYFNYLKDGKY